MKNRIVRNGVTLVLLFLFIDIGIAQNIRTIDSKLLDTSYYEIEQMDDQQKSFLFNPPSSFDLRNVNGNNYTTSVKNQQGGTCWCFSTMASLESNLLMTNIWSASGEFGSPDLAEYHLDWWNGFNIFNNDDDLGGDGLHVHVGGDFLLASAYLSRGEGAVREIDTPGDPCNTTPFRKYPTYHFYYPKNIEWFSAGSNLENINIIKETIMTKGAIATMHCNDDEFMCDYGSYKAFYQPPGSNFSGQHNVVIIGWDDNKITPATNATNNKTGAWLCKNSHFELGYYWISFYDFSCCQHPYQGAVSFHDVELLKYNSIYYHDYHGWRDTIRSADKAFNKFIAKANETLKAVSFFTAEDNLGFDVIIYDSFENGSLKNRLSSKSGTILYKGFHTIELDSTVPLQKGSEFYIYLSLSEGGQPIDRTSFVTSIGDKNRAIVNSRANPDESYYLIGSTWYDLYDYSFLDPTWNHTANFCIKALCINNDKKPFLVADPDGIEMQSIPPGDTVTFNIKISNFGDINSILNWNITNWPKWWGSSWTFTPHNGSLSHNSTVNVTVKVTLPEKKNKLFPGDIIIADVDDPNDYDDVWVRLTTSSSSLCIFKHSILDNMLILREHFRCCRYSLPQELELWQTR